MSGTQRSIEPHDRAAKASLVDDGLRLPAAKRALSSSQGGPTTPEKEKPLRRCSEPPNHTPSSVSELDQLGEDVATHCVGLGDTAPSSGVAAITHYLDRTAAQGQILRSFISALNSLPTRPVSYLWESQGLVRPLW